LFFCKSKLYFTSLQYNTKLLKFCTLLIFVYSNKDKELNYSSCLNFKVGNLLKLKVNAYFEWAKIQFSHNCPMPLPFTFPLLHAYLLFGDLEVVKGTFKKNTLNSQYSLAQELCCDLKHLSYISLFRPLCGWLTFPMPASDQSFQLWNLLKMNENCKSKQSVGSSNTKMFNRLSTSSS
jgi:hypothetical protein